MITDAYLHLNNHMSVELSVTTAQAIKGKAIAESITAGPKGLVNDSSITNVSHDDDLLQRSQIRWQYSAAAFGKAGCTHNTTHHGKKLAQLEWNKIRPPRKLLPSMFWQLYQGKSLCPWPAALLTFSPPHTPIPQSYLQKPLRTVSVTSTIRPALKFLFITVSYYQLLSTLSIISFLAALNRM